MRFIYVLFACIVITSARAIVKYPFKYTDCAPRSKLMLKISPNPPNFYKRLKFDVSLFATHDYNSLTYFVDIWAGYAPGHTQRVMAIQGSMCSMTGFKCKGKLGDFTHASGHMEFLGIWQKYTFYNATARVMNENGNLEACANGGGSVINWH